MEICRGDRFPASSQLRHLGKEELSQGPIPGPTATAHPCVFRKWSSSTEAISPRDSQVCVGKAETLAAGDCRKAGEGTKLPAVQGCPARLPVNPPRALLSQAHGSSAKCCCLWPAMELVVQIDCISRACSRGKILG